LEIARHRLPGATFDSLLQEALAACDEGPEVAEEPVAAPVALDPPRPRLVSLSRPVEAPVAVERERMPVVLTPDPSPQMGQG
jgi:hypothetical protein